MARRNSQQSVSLFPFLAVLVCTMGALILLLLVTTRRIRQEQARYTAAVDVLDDLTKGDLANTDDVSVNDFVVATAQLKASPATDPEAVTEIAPEFQAEWLPENDTSAEQRDQLQKQLADAALRQMKLQQQKQTLETRLSDQKIELAQVKVQIEQIEVELLTTGRAVRKLEEAETKLQALKSEKEDLELQISQQQQLLAGVKTELEEKSLFTEEAEAVLTKRESALVSLRSLVAKSSENLAQDSSTTKLEFTNTDGTSKVPIVLSVDEDGFTFEPTGITLTEKDLKGFPRNDNPLLAGIQAAAAHRSTGLLADDAYVLLLVRPTGSLGFYQAQQVLNIANIHFGYELIEADQVVELGEANSEEVKVVRQSILEALNRRSTLYGALLAAQQTSEQRAKESEQQQQLLADAGNQSQNRFGSDGAIRSGGPKGPDGRTLQEQLALGRFYAGGEPKPAPDLSRYRNRRSEREQRNRTGQQSVAAAPSYQRNLAGSPTARQEATPPATHDAKIQPQPPQLAAVQSPSSNATGQEANGSGNAQQSDATGQGDSKSLLEIRSDRTSTLSENMGLNGQLTADEMPNAKVAERTNGGQPMPPQSVADRISPDVDWPFAEAAPQQEGIRPVDPELFSNFGGSEAGQSSPSQSSLGQPQTASTFGSPSEASSQQPSRTFEDFVSTEGQPQSQPDFLPTQRPTGNLPPSIASTDQKQQQQSANDAVPFLDRSQQNNAFGTPGSEGSGAGRARPVDPRQSYLQQFLDEVEEQRAKEVPNAVLLRLLRRAKSSTDDQMSDNLSSGQPTPAQRPPEASNRKAVSQTRPSTEAHTDSATVTTAQSNSTTASVVRTDRQNPTPQQIPPQQTPPQAAPQKPVPQPVFYVVRVYVSDSQLIVGPYEPVDISGWTDKQVAQAAFLGVSETMKDVWANVRKDALPAVRFLVASGSQKRSQAASLELRRLDIPTRAMQVENQDFSLEQFFSDNLPPTSQTTNGRVPAVQPAVNGTRSPAANPQPGFQQQPETNSSQRTSI